MGDSFSATGATTPTGTPKPDFVLNQPEAKGAQILVAGDNFGCGSSREHAPWALTQYGFRAVISTSFADIFKGNSLKNGLLPIVVPADVHAELLASPGATVKIDLAAQTLTLADGRVGRISDRSSSPSSACSKASTSWATCCSRNARSPATKRGARGRSTRWHKYFSCRVNRLANLQRVHAKMFAKDEA